MSKLNPTLSRRHFLAVTGGTAAALPLIPGNVLGANNTVRLGLIGCGSRAGGLMKMFMNVSGTQFVAVSDPDTARMDQKVAQTQKGKTPPPAPEKIRDYRKLLERDDIDAVVIATPNHWHTLNAIHALQAGKAVYVEKPVSHSLWEGQQLIAAAKQNKAIIAAGYQNRSDPGPIEGIKHVQEGNLGKIKSVHVCCFRNRTSIGKQDTPLTPPESVDYNLWLGPAQDQPIYRPKFHYDWHWDFNTGNGDIGNQCPHEIDLACWTLGDSPLPTEIRSFGERFAWNDAGDTPNMITAWYEQAGVPVIIEVNDVRLGPERNTTSTRDGVRVGIVVRCEGGELRGGRGGMYTVADDGKTRLKKFPGNGGRDHQKNFIDAVRAGSCKGLRAQIEQAERSAAIAHLANISYREGKAADTKAVTKVVGKNPLLAKIVADQGEHLKAWSIDKPVYKLGKELKVDPKKVTIKTRGVDPKLARSTGRGEFVVPELT